MANENPTAIAGSLRRVWRNAGVPSDGTSGTYAGSADPGDLLIDTDNKTLYHNTNTQASPTWTQIVSSGAALSTDVADMAANGTSTGNTLGNSTKAAPINHIHKIGTHDHSDSTKGGSVAMGVVGSMAAAGTSTANGAGTGTAPAAIDHVHALGAHDHSGATKGDAIVLAALGSGFFSADDTARAKFATGFLNATKLLDIIAADAFSNANCDALFAASAFAADADSRLIFADGIWTTAKLATGIISADSAGRALFAAGVFDAATVLSAFADNSIPGSKVDWSYGTLPGNITPDDAADPGTSAYVARIDHVHGFACAAPSGGLAAADAEGAGTTMARSNHVHKAILADDVSFNFGTGSDAQIVLSAANLHASSTKEDLVIALSNNDQALHITDVGAIATNWNLADVTNPTVYIHSNTTPATDYLALYHDGTSGFIAAIGGALDLTAVGSVTVNDASADVDFRVESNDMAYMLYVDGAKNCCVIGENNDGSDTNYTCMIIRSAKTVTANQNAATFTVANDGAITIPTGTAPVVASVLLNEPNITATGTVTLAATLYITNAPTEGGTNAALYIASGATTLQALSVAGALTVAGAFTFNDASADVDFRVESDNLQYALYVDAGKDCVVIGDNTDKSDIDVRLWVGNVAKTLAANESASILWVAPTAATTTSAGAGVHGVIASAYFAEPNLTAGTGTITVAATVYIADAPTEGIANAALYVASGATTLQALGCAALTCASVTVTGGGAIKSSSSTEIGIQVTNGTLAVGSSGSIVIPYLSSTGAAFSDAIGGDLNGAIGINYDSDTGPTTTLEARVEGSWLSVALAGIEIQGRTFGGGKKHGEKWHDKQLIGENVVDETICVICGKEMKVEEPIVLYPNYERMSPDGYRNLHAVFAHLKCAK